MDLSRYPADEELLRAAASCVAYELGSMMHGRTLLKVPATDVYRNLYLEVFLVHARNLIEFFCPRKSARTTDIQARHFVPDWKATESVRRFGGWTSGAMLERIDQSLSHMTIFRVTENLTWDVASLHDDLVTTLGQLFALAQRERRALFEPHVLARFGYAADGTPATS